MLFSHPNEGLRHQFRSTLTAEEYESYERHAAQPIAKQLLDQRLGAAPNPYPVVSMPLDRRALISLEEQRARAQQARFFQEQEEERRRKTESLRAQVLQDLAQAKSQAKEKRQMLSPTRGLEPASSGTRDRPKIASDETVAMKELDETSSETQNDSEQGAGASVEKRMNRCSGIAVRTKRRSPQSSDDQSQTKRFRFADGTKTQSVDDGIETQMIDNVIDELLPPVRKVAGGGTTRPAPKTYSLQFGGREALVPVSAKGDIRDALTLDDVVSDVKMAHENESDGFFGTNLASRARALYRVNMMTVVGRILGLIHFDANCLGRWFTLDPEMVAEYTALNVVQAPAVCPTPLFALGNNAYLGIGRSYEGIVQPHVFDAKYEFNPTPLDVRDLEGRWEVHADVICEVVRALAVIYEMRLPDRSLFEAAVAPAGEAQQFLSRRVNATLVQTTRKQVKSSVFLGPWQQVMGQFESLFNTVLPIKIAVPVWSIDPARALWQRSSEGDIYARATKALQDAAVRFQKKAE